MPNTTLSLAALLVVVGYSTPLSAQPRYRPTFLGAGTHLDAMNRFGEVVGWTTVASNVRGFVASAERGQTLLPLPTGYRSSFADDINDRGQVAGTVGTSYSAEFGGEPALWTPDGQGGYTLALLGVLPGHSGGRALTLNSKGDVLGFCRNGNFRTAVRFDGGNVPQSLAATGVFDPVAINDQRVLVDSAYPPKRLDLDTMVVEHLGIPTGLPQRYVGAFAHDINEHGQVTAEAILATSGNCNRQPARYTDGIGWEILGPCGKYNAAYGINDGGDVVMQLATSPWVWLEGEGAFRIEDLIEAPVGHWYVGNTFGDAIANNQQLAVMASNSTTNQGGVLLLTRTTTCQHDLGFGGPGAARLSVCGGDLSAGNPAPAQLRGAAPSQPTALLLGAQALPTAWLGGTLVPLPVLAAVPATTNAAGEATLLTVPGGLGPALVFAQCAFLDPAAPGGVGLSNALEVALLP